MSRRCRAGVFGVVGVLGVLALSAPASAQGLFERIFGGLGRHNVERTSNGPTAFVDPFTSLANALNPPRDQRTAEISFSKGFCVRTCDGHFFPVQGRPGMSAAESCNAFCPASQTKVYSGAAIDNSVASDGSRYSDLPNAFAYRKQIVAGCTCNGRDAFGLARMDVASDPTLRPGDVVATKIGLMAFTGSKDKVANFTPIDSYRGLSQNARDKLADVKIMPDNPGAAEITTATIKHVRDTRGAQAAR
ncbi:MAG: DUF2865 domain-containing protein [Pseudolabrys sp.]